jgi:hypothetical protein
MSKVQAIYDAIDTGSHKQSIKLCDQVIKKSKGKAPPLILVTRL